MLEAEQIEVVTQDNRTLPARAVAYDLATGFGLLRPLAAAARRGRGGPLGSSRDLQPGEPLMAVTGPQADDDGDVSMTRLISRRAFSGSWEYHIESALFTSPPVLASGGNHSGAPLFNQKGELMGIGSLLRVGRDRRKPAPAGQYVCAGGFAAPHPRGAAAFGLQREKPPALAGPHIERPGRAHTDHAVSKDSPADLAGLGAGDVVLAVDDAKVATLEAFYKKLWDRSAPDAEIRLTVLQGADIKTIVLKAQDRMLTLKKPAGI
jgi:serine protease Do